MSLIGTWIQRLAGQWLVYRLAGGTPAHGALMLGTYGFVTQIPMTPAAPLAGVWVDRLDKRRVLIWTQTAAMVQALALSALVFTRTAALWNVFALGIALCLINSFDMPARQAFAIDMIEKKEDLPNAIALNSFMVNAAKVMGPVCAGLLIWKVGMGDCFLLNGISYIGVIWAIVAMRVVQRPRSAEQAQAWDEFRQGLGHAAQSVPIRSVLIMLFVVCLVAVPYTDMLPIVVKQVFGDNARSLGWLRAAPGFGAVAGAMWLATRNSATGLARVVPIAAAIFGLGLIGFSFTMNLTAAVALLGIAGLGLIVQMASINTIVQTAVDDDKRGRVMSLYALAMQGPLPWGSLIAGGVTAVVGVENTFRIAGICCLLAAAAFALRLPAWGDAGRMFTTRPDRYTEAIEPPAVS